MPLSYFLDEDEDVEFQVMFRDLQKNVAQLSPQERAAVELMAKSLLEAKKSDDKN